MRPRTCSFRPPAELLNDDQLHGAQAGAGERSAAQYQADVIVDAAHLLRRNGLLTHGFMHCVHAFLLVSSLQASPLPSVHPICSLAAAWTCRLQTPCAVAASPYGSLTVRVQAYRPPATLLQPRWLPADVENAPVLKSLKRGHGEPFASLACMQDSKNCLQPPTWAELRRLQPAMLRSLAIMACQELAACAHLLRDVRAATEWHDRQASSASHPSRMPSPLKCSVCSKLPLVESKSLLCVALC